MQKIASQGPDFERNYEGKPADYVCGIARMIYLEWTRHPSLRSKPPLVEAPKIDQVALACLEKCMATVLTEEERALILAYYEGEKRAKIEHHEAAARRYGGHNALRIRVCRIRAKLRECLARAVSVK